MVDINELENICSLEEAFDNDSAGEIENSGVFGALNDTELDASVVGRDIALKFFGSFEVCASILNPTSIYIEIGIEDKLCSLDRTSD